MPGDSPVNIGDLLLVPWQAEQRVLGVQAKLHHWAARDDGRRFDDLFNLVVDPAFLALAGNGSGRTRARRPLASTGPPGGRSKTVRAAWPGSWKNCGSR